jgi:hypothetical protein
MKFTKKIILLVIANIILVGSVYCYFAVINAEYYFPGNYEIAFAWIAYTIIFCFIMTVLFIIYHVIKAKRRDKD